MVEGQVASGFEGVRDAFVRCFSELGETGAGFTAILDGRVVVELRGGVGFAADSLVHLYSVTKPAAAFCVLVLADRGELRLDDPVARVWPELSAASSGRLTVRGLLAHQAGLVALREAQPTATILDPRAVCRLLEAEEPWWEPGTGHGEHALFYGHLCGELVRRVDGRSLGRFWREEVATPWSLDLHIGLSPEEGARTLDVEGRLDGWEGDVQRLALGNPPGLLEADVVNSREWREAEIPAVNGHGTATAVARLYAGLVAGGTLDGVRLVAPETVEAMTAGELTAPDVLLGSEVTWGLGVQVDADGFGMGGIGGSLGLADPALGLAEAYVTRRLADHARADLMDAAVRDALASLVTDEDRAARRS